MAYLIQAVKCFKHAFDFAWSITPSKQTGVNFNACITSAVNCIREARDLGPEYDLGKGFS